MRRAILFLAAIGLALGASSEDLRKAVRSADVEQVRTLLKQGIPISETDSLGGTALHDAVWAGETEIVKLLLDAGASVNASHTEAGSTPLHYAIITNRVEIAELLIAKGADTKARYRGDATPLHLAANRGNRAMLELLLTHGADINARDWRGRTPFRIAEGAKQSFHYQDWPETAALLQRLGADTSLGIPGTIHERLRGLAATK